MFHNKKWADEQKCMDSEITFIKNHKIIEQEVFR